jgi:hypothetical protein
VIAGQGTVAKELIEEVGPLDLLFVCVGGGGLISGCALAAAQLSPQCKIIGVEPEAEVMHPGHSAEDTLRAGALADHFGLVKSGGSDWHGATSGPRVLGGMRVPGEWLEIQDARVEKRRSAAVA